VEFHGTEAQISALQIKVSARSVKFLGETVEETNYISKIK
jgi:hypothetical protein